LIEGVFLGSVQPMSWKETQSLSVGRQDAGKVKIYSDIKLPVSREGGTTPGALVLWQNEKWELIDESVFQNDLINHYKYIGELRK